ncbi:Toxin YeeV [Serratia fonticola]|nr:toxin [Serratia fonticola]CAI2041359.1 Toxin YeeV [Serratia fonticola]
MKAIDKIPHTEPKKPALIEYQQLLAWLLDHYYGLTLNDTPYHDPLAIAQQIEYGVTVRETVNELVQKFDLVRVDRPGFSLLAQSDPERQRYVAGSQRSGATNPH